MAVFASNEDFDDIQDQLQYVRSSLGYKVTQDELDSGCSRRGDGWSSPFYYLYCDNCKMEIEKPWIDPDDEEKCERCPECKKDTQLCTKQERKQEIQQRIDDLLKEEAIMERETARWKLFRDKYPLDENVHLEYNENEQWTACRDGIDLQEYVINNWYIPLKRKDLKARAATLYAKYCIIKDQRKKALTEKEYGNRSFKSGKFKNAIRHYTLSIQHRTDFKASYLNRALMYLKLSQYDDCIHDCCLVIDMISIVNLDTKALHTNELFKAHLRRSNALKCQSKYEEAKRDLDEALALKPKDGAAKKLLHEIKVELRHNKLRQQMSKFDWDDHATLSDFDGVLDLSIQFLSESLAAESSESFKFESRDSDELFRRLYVFMCRNKKYTVRFVKRDGIHFCLKYLHTKLKSLSGVAVTDKQIKLNLLLRPYSILTMCCEESVNLEEMRRKKHEKSIRMVILLTMKYFDEMDRVLAGQSMRFVSIILESIESVRDHIALKSGSKMMQHFVKFQKNTDPFTQNTNSIRCLFEIFATLYQCPNFRQHLYFQSSPYLYKILLHSMSIYNDCILKMEDKQAKQDDFDNLEYAISVILDGLGLILDAESCLGRSRYSNNNDDDSKLQTQTKLMVQHFIQNKNIKSYMMLITGYLKRCYVRYKAAQEMQDKVRYIGQLVRAVNVVVQISDPLYSEVGAQNILYRFNIDKEMPLLMAVIDDQIDASHAKMRSMIKLIKYKLLAYLDHVADHVKFDQVFGCSKVDKPMDRLPFFWSWMMKVLVEPYKEKQITPKLMEEFSMCKSRCIRTLYRWCQRRKDKSYILELMIKKYLDGICEWMSYGDEQIMANVTLVICEFLKYSMRNNRTKKKHIKKALTRQRLKDCAKLMTTKHHVIQYNAMLLMANIIDFDRELATIATGIGAARLLECYKKSKNKHPAVAHHP